MRYTTARTAAWLIWLAGIVVFLFVSASAHAATFGLHLATAHFGNAGGATLHSATPGIYLRTDAGLTLGAFRNSYARPSAYAAWTWETDDHRFALTAGAITGYQAARVMPLVAPSARIALGQGFAARVVFFPKPIKHGHAAGLHLAIERSF